MACALRHEVEARHKPLAAHKLVVTFNADGKVQVAMLEILDLKGYAYIPVQCTCI